MQEAAAIEDLLNAMIVIRKFRVFLCSFVIGYQRRFNSVFESGGVNCRERIRCVHCGNDPPGSPNLWRIRESSSFCWRIQSLWIRACFALALRGHFYPVEGSNSCFLDVLMLYLGIHDVCGADGESVSSRDAVSAGIRKRMRTCSLAFRNSGFLFNSLRARWKSSMLSVPRLRQRKWLEALCWMFWLRKQRRWVATSKRANSSRILWQKRQHRISSK